jgi:Spx/MgsR family transcriptional regulator
MIVYVYGKCSTCKDALRFLDQHQIHYTRKEITDHPPSLKELQAMLKTKEGNLKKLFNTSGMLYKEMDLSQKLDSMPDEQALKLLSQQGMFSQAPFCDLA